MQKKIFYSFLILVLFVNHIHAQDVHFSQFYETAILRNPAMTGIFNGDYKVNAIYRNQWSSISKPYQTGQVSFESRIPVNKGEANDFISLGLLGYYDQAGSIDLKTISVYPAVNYNKSLEDHHNSFISAGFTAGYVQRSFDPGKMTFNSQFQNGSFNPYNGNGELITDPKFSYWDLGAGISFSSSSGENNSLTYYLGVAGYHFTKPKSSFMNNGAVQMDMRWNLNAGLGNKLGEKTALIIHSNFSVQGKYTEMLAGGLFSWKNAPEEQDPVFTIYAGAFYRLGDAIIPVLKLDYLKYSFGLSYDVNVSKLRTASSLRGGYELSVVKTGLFSDPNWKRGRTLCPHSFW